MLCRILSEKKEGTIGVKLRPKRPHTEKGEGDRRKKGGDSRLNGCSSTAGAKWSTGWWFPRGGKFEEKRGGGGKALLRSWEKKRRRKKNNVLGR